MSEVNTDLNRPSRPWSYRVLDALIILFVLGVIAVVLFPIFARNRPICRKSTCQSNLKECAIALQVYWNDYDSHLPSSALVNHSDKWNRADFIRFATKRGPVPIQAKTHRRTWCQVLYPNMKSKDIVFCNSDPADRNDPRSEVSYYWKLAIDKAWYGEGCKKPCRRETDFAYNSDDIIFYERRGFHSGAPSGLTNGVQINVAFLDTHVRSITLTNATSGDPNNCAASDGEPMYFNFDNDKPKSTTNPPPPAVAASHVDPGRYSDMLP